MEVFHLVILAVQFAIPQADQETSYRAYAGEQKEYVAIPMQQESFFNDDSFYNDVYDVGFCAASLAEIMWK